LVFPLVSTSAACSTSVLLPDLWFFPCISGLNNTLLFLYTPWSLYVSTLQKIIHRSAKAAYPLEMDGGSTCSWSPGAVWSTDPI